MAITHGGKGSGRRPTYVSQQEMADNWERIFGKKDRFSEKNSQENNQPISEDSINSHQTDCQATDH
jgi:hypothetical protein